MSAPKQKYRYQLKAEGTGNFPGTRRVFEYGSAKAVGGVIESLDDKDINFEGVVTVRRIKNDTAND